MSCCNGDLSNGYGYGYVCQPDVPYPQVSPESVTSQITNLATSLYGAFQNIPAGVTSTSGITKSLVNGQVVWTVACAPTSTTSVFGVTPNAGEGFLCFLIRALTTGSAATTGTVPKAYGNVTVGGALVAGSFLPATGLSVVLTGSGGVYTITYSGISSTSKVIINQTSGAGYGPLVTLGTGSCTVTTYAGATPTAQAFSFIIY